MRVQHKALTSQSGNTLIVVLVVLTLLALSGFGAMRAADTGNVISGNFAFQQAATHASDRAVSDARNNLAGIVAGGGGNNDVANRYSATRLVALDALGVPTTINWAGVACADETGAAVPNCGVDAGNYRVQYFIERLCSTNPNLTNVAEIRARCEYEPSTAAAAASTIAVRYRVIIRVRGPRASESWYEAVMSGPATPPAP